MIQPRLSLEYRKLVESKKRKSDNASNAAKIGWKKRKGDADAMRTHSKRNADVMPKNAIAFAFASSIETTPLPPASGGPSEGDALDSFAASLSEEYREVIAAWREATGISCSPDTNTREGARIFAKAIADEGFPKNDLVAVIKAGLADSNLPSQGLRGVANNRCKYLPKRTAVAVGRVNALYRCETCGFEVGLAIGRDTALNGFPVPCSSGVGCGGKMVIVKTWE